MAKKSFVTSIMAIKSRRCSRDESMITFLKSHYILANCHYVLVPLLINETVVSRLVSTEARDDKSLRILCALIRQLNPYLNRWSH